MRPLAIDLAVGIWRETMPRRADRRRFLKSAASRGLEFGAILVASTTTATAQIALPRAKLVPGMQVEPLPGDQASVQRDGVELSRYHFGPTLRRPFLFPIIGASGRSLTRMGHPHDPVGHSHHNSVWVAHHDVNGDSFWDDHGPGRIVQRRILRYDDGAEAAIFALNAWIGKDDRVHMLERRGVIAQPLDQGEWLLSLDHQFIAETKPATLGATPFGMVGVRMAKSIGVKDGGGLIRNSEGQVNEQGPAGAFRKRARWVDYSGPITREAVEGITLFDHPSNPNHPSHFHVREDGWMGASLTLEGSRTIEPGHSLRLRYGLYVHKGLPQAETIETRWRAFAASSIADLPA